METAARNLSNRVSAPPADLLQVDGDWIYPEFAGENGISSLDNEVNDKAQALPPEEERNRILDLFRN